MKKTILILILIFSINNLIAQTKYTAKSGQVFKIGDTLKLGQPINISSGPLIATNGQWATIFTEKNNELRNMNFINKKVIITKISLDGKAKLFFKLYGKKLFVLIDEAISNGEVSVSYKKQNNFNDKFDKIKKLKELLDMGAITKEEFESEKKKLLDGN
jgi:Short C-terminal domain